MKKFILIYLIAVTISYSQSFQVEKITGTAQMLSNGSETWQPVKLKMLLDENTIISTDKNSSVNIKSADISFILKESSAITISNIKKMSLDELVLALAMENVMNAPRKKGNTKSDNTAVYGDKINKETLSTIKSNDFGLKRINGAKQLAENGMKESAIITAKEIYRKYPDTKKDAETRIYFADLLFERGLYEESLDEYAEIKSLQLNAEQKIHVNNKIDQINKKLINK
ncbi:MAG: hypothetical protein IT276_15840 [Ignavibacteriaceae bacterium]|nr:hypothetical protein [Ignavibacteriaceae bacterium]HMN24651.1 hypothetical protein [Ignavibacteriaceae bacterium]HRN25808.1 hypothetical protein [Ignavibacteriaceae bacterium]HRP93162.1 hypothetical protein [Ignavibacteriaceae bacterium]HRQ53497.1 hypothetical protein [Ignavibacteriaceae bacterium]